MEIAIYDTDKQESSVLSFAQSKSRVPSIPSACPIAEVEPKNNDLLRSDDITKWSRSASINLLGLLDSRSL